MARAYTVATAALALGADIKWVDNILSHFAVEGVVQGRQGVSRRISTDAVLRLGVIHELSSRLRVPIEVAVEVATALAQEGSLAVGRGVALRLDRGAAINDLQSRLDFAVESAPLPKRGRPATKAKRGA